MLGLALGVTVVVGGAAVGLVPQLKDANAAAADTGSAAPAALQTAVLDPVDVPEVEPVVAPVAAVLPDDSGSGRRIVFDQSEQHVWLIDGDGSIARSYAVSGSRFDNLHPGTYAVQRRLRHATAFDYKSTMEYFVQFTHGANSAIGFHAVPVDRGGKLEQTKAQLGTPLSAGCIRQWKPDAIALWDFAPVGTKVVVTA